MSRIALAALLVSSAATAKKIESGADDDYVTAPLSVRASLDGPTAHMFVDYRVTTSSDSSSTQFDMPLPFGGVVVGATITHAGTTHSMALDSADNAQKQFEAAFGNPDPDANPKTWAVKIDANAYGVRGYGVSVLIGAPLETELGITLEVTAPTCFFRDTRYVRMPEEWQRAVHAAKPSDDVVAACTITDGSDRVNTWKSFAAPEAARMPSGERLFTRAVRLAVDNDFHLARTELAVASNIADIPRDLATVILVDESRSMNDRQRRAQREIVIGYLRAAPNSRVHVIGFSRRTRPLLPGWTIASRASSRLERELASMTPRNGSNFDLGLTDAGRLLSAIKGTRRVLLVTDEAMAARLATRPENLASLVPEGTIINVAVTDVTGDVDDKGNEILTRHDNARLARLAAATTGFATSIGEIDLQQRTSIDASMLVRPISLDHIRTTGLGWSDLEDTERQSLGGHSCRDSLEAGESCVWWTRGSKFASTIQLEGVLWNRRVVRVVRPLADPGHTIAREIVGTGTSMFDERPDIDGDSVVETSKRINALAHAVTPTTSLFVRWGGSVPFPDGVSIGGLSGFGRSSSIGSISDVGIGTSLHVDKVDLASQLRPLVANCGLGTTRAEVTIELTFEEIVSVDVTLDATGAATLRSCIEDVVWDFAPSLPTREPTRTETVVL